VVGLFFFLSGYGIEKSNSSEGKISVYSFLRKFIMLIVPMLIPNACLVILRIVDGNAFTLPEILYNVLNFWNSDRINTVMWFLFNLLLLNLVFYVSFGIFKRRKILCAFLLTLVMTLSFMFLTDDRNTYGMNFSFVAGIAFSTYEVKLNQYIMKRPLKIILISLSIFSILLLSYYYLYDNAIIGQLIVRNMLSTSFSLFVFLIGTCVRLKNVILFLLGKISFEIYLYHIVMIRLFRSNITYINSDLIYVLIVLVSTIGIAFIMQKLNRKLYVFCKRNLHSKTC
jgi:peptidoglycan/LPS O-acetylase OafA/YrhL